MIILVFGNPDVDVDSLPLKILPELSNKFPDIDFQFKDPNEDWDLSSIDSVKKTGRITVLDTVFGLEKVTVIEDINKFTLAPKVSMHDFDALSNLRYLIKLGKIKSVTVIGVPPDITEIEAVEQISEILKKLK
jgi:hypothetical protein